MEYRRLGSSGLRVSALGLGTMQLPWFPDDTQPFEILDAFWAAGGNFIDTANIYGPRDGTPFGGEAETLLGRWMAERRNRAELVVATKVRGEMWSGPNGAGLSRSHIVRAIDGSLRRLRTDYLDLYQVHWPDAQTPIEETLQTLDDLVRQGKVRYLGCSNFSGWRLVEALLIARQAGWSEFVSVQPHWSLVERENFERHVLPVVRKYALGVLPYSPQGKGFLTGKYRRDQPPPASRRLNSIRKLLTERNFGILETLTALGQRRGKTSGQMALAWLLNQPGVTAPIVGASSAAQVMESLGSLGIVFNLDELQALEAASGWPRTGDDD